MCRSSVTLSCQYEPNVSRTLLNLSHEELKAVLKMLIPDRCNKKKSVVSIFYSYKQKLPNS